MAGFAGEKITEGLDGLRERLAEYKKMGARFAKWRAVIKVGQNAPTSGCLEANVHALTRYAALCQEAGIVPIVEPEVLMAGNHSLQQCFDVTAGVLKLLFYQMYRSGILPETLILMRYSVNLAVVYPGPSVFLSRGRFNSLHWKCGKGKRVMWSRRRRYCPDGLNRMSRQIKEDTKPNWNKPFQFLIFC